MSKFDPVKLNPAFDHHKSHGLGEHVTGHAVPGNIARDGAPKRVHDIKVHGGQVKIAKNGFRAVGGDHASAIDSLTGGVVVPGAVKSTPGYGNAGLSQGHPFAKAPQSKTVKAAPPAFGMRSRTSDQTKMNELGAAILDAAFSASSPDDRMAHGRKR